MSNDKKNSLDLARRTTAVWDYVFQDSRSVRDTFTHIIEKPSLLGAWSTLQDLQSEYPHIRLALFESLRKRVEDIITHLSFDQTLTPTTRQLMMLQVYQLLCFVTYTEPSPGQTIRIPILSPGDQESPSTFRIVTYTINTIELCGRKDDPYCAYELVAKSPDNDAPRLLLFPGTAPLPWQRGAYLTYASDISPYRAVGSTIYQASREKLNKLLSSDHPTIAIGHSLGGAMCGMLAKDHPNIAFRAFLAPLSISYSNVIYAALLHLSCIAIIAAGLYFGFPILPVLGLALATLLIAPLAYSLFTYTYRNISAKLSTKDTAAKKISQDGLPQHLLVTQQNDIVSNVGDTLYTPTCSGIHLTHKGTNQDFIRAHTQAFTHLDSTTMHRYDAEQQTLSFRRILFNAYWEMVLKPCTTLLFHLYFTISYSLSPKKTEEFKTQTLSQKRVRPEGIAYPHQSRNRPRSYSAPTTHITQENKNNDTPSSRR